jgi:hypothetical protein
MQRTNAQGLLFSPSCSRKDRYKNQLDLLPEEDELLRTCREDVKAAIREGFDAIRKAYASGVVEFRINGRAVALEVDIMRQLSRVSPRFKVQGSYAYKTMNRPAQPPQQMDLDMGVYFPMSIVQNEPEIANNLIFEAVDGILKHLAKVKGWVFDGSKDTCSRLVVNRLVHIDVPMYAIPGDKVPALDEAHSAFAMAELKAKETIELDPNEVYLALRNQEQWVQSDPMKVRNWFEGACIAYKSQGDLRRVSRFLKGWRDQQWAEGGPSSITLMACAANTFAAYIKAGKPKFDSDCAALLAIARHLPTQLEAGVKNPSDPEEPNLFPRGKMSADEKQAIVQKARTFKATMEAALTQPRSPEEVVQLFTTSFGQRIPQRPELIVIGLNPIQQVKATPAIIQDEPAPQDTMRAG